MPSGMSDRLLGCWFAMSLRSTGNSTPPGSFSTTLFAVSAEMIGLFHSLDLEANWPLPFVVLRSAA